MNLVQNSNLAHSEEPNPTRIRRRPDPMTAALLALSEKGPRIVCELQSELKDHTERRIRAKERAQELISILRG